MLVPVAAMALTRCAGTEVTVRDHVVTAPELSYTYGPVAPGWRSVSIADNDAAWFDPSTDGLVHVDHTCERSQDTPLAALVAHLLIGFTDRRTVTEETVALDGREARHVVVIARLDGVPRSLELYVVKKDGCVYDLGYVATPPRFDTGRPAFDAFVRGFHTLRSPMSSPMSNATADPRWPSPRLRPRSPTARRRSAVPRSRRATPRSHRLRRSLPDRPGRSCASPTTSAGPP